MKKLFLLATLCLSTAVVASEAPEEQDTLLESLKKPESQELKKQREEFLKQQEKRHKQYNRKLKSNKPPALEVVKEEEEFKETGEEPQVFAE